MIEIIFKEIVSGKMVTELQLLKAVNSLEYRRRLEEKISELEATIFEYMKAHETDYVRIDCYHVLRDKRDIIVYKLPVTDADQLNLDLYTQEIYS